MKRSHEMAFTTTDCCGNNINNKSALKRYPKIHSNDYSSSLNSRKVSSNQFRMMTSVTVGGFDNNNCSDISESIKSPKPPKEESATFSESLDSSTPGIFTSVTPAWNNRNLKCLAEKVHSNLVFAHVRAASPSSITTDVNCHPFSYKKFVSIINLKTIK